MRKEKISTAASFKDCKQQGYLYYPERRLSLKQGTGNGGTGNEERGTGNGESLKGGISKRGNL